MSNLADARAYEVCNAHILDVLESARQLIILADEAEAHSKDDGCVVLYGVVRDCAYKMRLEANRERDAHKAKMCWSEKTASKDDETLRAKK